MLILKAGKSLFVQQQHQVFIKSTRKLSTLQISATSKMFDLYNINGMQYEACRSKQSSARPAQSSVLAVFVHGNGLCKQVFRQMISETMRRNPSEERDLHTISLDLAAHGGSSPDLFQSRNSLEEFAPDIVSCVNDYRKRNNVDYTVLVGHSVGAHISLLAEYHHGPIFDSAFLIEPMIMPFWSAEMLPEQFIDAAKRRRNQFASRESAIEYFSTRGIFQYWEKACVEDYVNGGTKQIDPNKPEIILACEPQVESRLFQIDVSAIYPHLDKLKLKKVAIFEGEESGYLPAGHLEDMAKTKCKNAEYHLIPNGRHILMCEKPALMAQYLIQFLADACPSTQKQPVLKAHM